MGMFDLEVSPLRANQNFFSFAMALTHKCSCWMLLQKSLFEDFGTILRIVLKSAILGEGPLGACALEEPSSIESCPS